MTIEGIDLFVMLKSFFFSVDRTKISSALSQSYGVFRQFCSLVVQANAERDSSLNAEPNPPTGSAAAPLHLILWARLLHDAEPWCCLVNIKDALMPTGHSHFSSFSPFPHSPALPTHNHLAPLVYWGPLLLSFKLFPLLSPSFDNSPISYPNQQNQPEVNKILFADQSNRKPVLLIVYFKHSGGARISFWAGCVR
ncbi:hypothetical protein PGTUg99_016824 [Puccinia graminis f. sp. tritici]|uniref:Uncharacterized protein n=1 Tax=Puccinia graminis f. sp. tritici TaxID=56615 RepID=A0A5B0NP02_PUCGR|nr:hypothetical protein PGTUg99_016824 [Puccinia graminis f. sp. tritici]